MSTHPWLNKLTLPVSLFLQAIISGQRPSRWLHSHKTPIYLEDDHQIDQVYQYFKKLHDTAVAATPCAWMEQVPFILDVLLPEVD